MLSTKKLKDLAVEDEVSKLWLTPEKVVLLHKWLLAMFDNKAKLWVVVSVLLTHEVLGKS